MRSSYVPYCRGRKFYGKPIIEGVQHPSETIYMPNYINHAVYNLDKTVGIGDNPFYSTAIEESAFQLFRKGSNPYSYIEDLQVKPRYYPDLKGALQISKLLSNSHHPQYTIDNPFLLQDSLQNESYDDIAILLNKSKRNTLIGRILEI